MTILLTGASGFIGREIKSQGLANYRCVYRQEQRALDDSFIVSGIDATTDWNGAFVGCEAVIHLAGIAHNKGSSVEDFYKVNFEGTVHLAQCAAKAGVKRFVFVSTLGVLGNRTDENGFSNSSPVAPHNDYAKSKWQAEQALFDLQDETGMEVVVVRPPLVYGRGAPGNFGMLTKLVKLSPILPFGSVDNKRSIISTKNLADFLYRCTYLQEVKGKAWLIAEPSPVSTSELIRQIAKAENKLSWQLPVPTALMTFAASLIGKRQMAEQLFGDLVVHSEETCKAVGWTPPYTMQQSLSICSQEES